MDGLGPRRTCYLQFVLTPTSNVPCSVVTLFQHPMATHLGCRKPSSADLGWRRLVRAGRCQTRLFWGRNLLRAQSLWSLPWNILVIPEASIFRKRIVNMANLVCLPGISTSVVLNTSIQARSPKGNFTLDWNTAWRARCRVVFVRDTRIFFYRAWCLKVKIHGPGSWAPTCPSGTGMEKRPLYPGRDLRWPKLIANLLVICHIWPIKRHGTSSDTERHQTTPEGCGVCDRNIWLFYIILIVTGQRLILCQWILRCRAAGQATTGMKFCQISLNSAWTDNAQVMRPMFVAYRRIFNEPTCPRHIKSMNQTEFT